MGLIFYLIWLKITRKALRKYSGEFRGNIKKRLKTKKMEITPGIKTGKWSNLLNTSKEL